MGQAPSKGKGLLRYSAMHAQELSMATRNLRRNYANARRRRNNARANARRRRNNARDRLSPQARALYAKYWELTKRYRNLKQRSRFGASRYAPDLRRMRAELVAADAFLNGVLPRAPTNVAPPPLLW